MDENKDIFNNENTPSNDAAVEESNISDNNASQDYFQTNTQADIDYTAQGEQYFTPFDNSDTLRTSLDFDDEPVKADEDRDNKGFQIAFIIVSSLLLVALIFILISLLNGNLNDPAAAENTTNQQGYVSGDGTIITTSPTPDTPSPTGEVLSSVEVAEIGRASCVGVLVYSTNGYSQQQIQAGEGTGVVASISKDGKSTYIITCAHVISDPGVSVKILLENGTTYDASIVGFDLHTDVGVLKVNTTNLHCAQFGEFSKLKVGSPVYAVGNPGGSEFFGSVTSGIVSAISRSINNEIGYTMDCIQHDAAINPGNSGGALLNEYGQVIGINSSKIASTEYEGMSFAVPISTVLDVTNNIIDRGYVPNRPKLGITYTSAVSHQTYAMVVRIKDLPEGSLIIRGIADDSDLKNSDVQIGDMIIAVNGKELDTPDILLDIIDASAVGDKLTLKICRVNPDYSTKEFDVEVTLVEDKGSTAPAKEETTTYANPYEYFEQHGGGY